MVAEKPLTAKNVHLYYIREKEGKNEKLKKEGKRRISILISIYTVHFAFLKVTQNLKTLAQIGAEKSATEIFIGEKEKRTNKRTDKQYVAVLLLHDTTYHYQALHQISES